jgi:hypothetical protein
MQELIRQRASEGNISIPARSIAPIEIAAILVGDGSVSTARSIVEIARSRLEELNSLVHLPPHVEHDIPPSRSTGSWAGQNA